MLVLGGCSLGSSEGDSGADSPCADPDSALTDGLRTLESGGERRTYLLERPGNVDSDSPLPLVMNIHGATGSIERQLDVSGMSEIADREGFVHVVPQSHQSPGRTGGSWVWSPDGRDVAFLFDLLDEVVARTCVDPDRIYLTGFSQGGYLSLVMACRQPERIAAVAPVAGLVDIDVCDQSVPVPVLAIHGTADDIMSYDGVMAPKFSAVLGYDEGPDVPALAGRWAARNGCAEGQTTESVSDEWTRTLYPCAVGAVDLYTKLDGKHEWPERVGDDPTGELIWEFFEGKRLED